MPAHKPSILLIEDSEELSELFRYGYQSEYAISFAADGATGLSAARTARPDIIVLDLKLPDRGGIAILQELKASTETRDIPVLILTSDSQTESVLAGFGAGAADYVVKPFKFTELSARIRSQVTISRLQASLRDKEIFVQSVMKSMTSGLMVTAADGTVRMINSAGAGMLGVSREEIEGKKLVDVLPDAFKLTKVMDFSIGRGVTVETSQGPVQIGYNTTPFTGPDGDSGGAVVVFRDISEITKLQEKLRDEDRFAAIGKVAAGVAHEIRNPLFGITSVAQILTREAGDGTPQKELLEAMLSETSRLNTLVEELLIYGRTARPSLSETDLHALAQSVLSLHAPAIQNKELIVRTDFDPEMPPLALDQHQIKQVLLNLLMNSLDASSRGGSICMSTRAGADGAVLTIADDGKGIPGGDLDRVFDLFFTTKEKGTGLGLAICRRIIEDHGGALTITSPHTCCGTGGPGTMVTVKFPLPGAGGVGR